MLPNPAPRHTEKLSLPDDITALGQVLFTAFQNGVGLPVRGEALRPQGMLFAPAPH